MTTGTKSRMSPFLKQVDHEGANPVKLTKLSIDNQSLPITPAKWKVKHELHIGGICEPVRVFFSSISTPALLYDGVGTCSNFALLAALYFKLHSPVESQYSWGYVSSFCAAVQQCLTLCCYFDVVSFIKALSAGSKLSGRKVSLTWKWGVDVNAASLSKLIPAAANQRQTWVTTPEMRH